VHRESTDHLRTTPNFSLVNEYRSDSLRQSTFFFSVILRVFAFLTFIGTVIATWDVTRAGSRILGLSASHDPASWAVGAIGLILSVLLAGVGSGLALTCAMYDRQTKRPATPRARETSIPDAPNRSRILPVATRLPSDDEGNASPIIATTDVALLKTETPDTRYLPGSVMDHLTRKRHLFRDRSD
jgi:hypothetical protein